MTHTPGPWEVQDPLFDSVWIVQSGLEPHAWSCIASVRDDASEDAFDRGASRPISTAERDANAKLIAAAPDLLDALNEVMAWVDNWSPDFVQDGEWPETAELVKAAIAKATT